MTLPAPRHPLLRGAEPLRRAEQSGDRDQRLRDESGESEGDEGWREFERYQGVDI